MSLNSQYFYVNSFFVSLFYLLVTWLINYYRIFVQGCKGKHFSDTGKIIGRIFRPHLAGLANPVQLYPTRNFCAFVTVFPSRDIFLFLCYNSNEFSFSRKS